MLTVDGKGKFLADRRQNAVVGNALVFTVFVFAHIPERETGRFVIQIYKKS